MRRIFALSIPTLALLLAPMQTQAAPWMVAPQSTFNDAPPGYWSTKVELADINGDGWVDILFANVGGYQAGTPDSILANQAFINNEGMGFSDESLAVFGPNPNDPMSPDIDTARVIKAYDFDSDGDLDLLVGSTWQSKSRYYMNEGGGVFTEVPGNVPDQLVSIGDFEVGDVDYDGDLDVVFTNWGSAPVGFVNSPGGVTGLWLNDGFGVFTDATADAMPQISVNWSWELELLDVDNDWDLDIAISCRACPTGGFLFENDGGVFSNATPGNLPQKAGSVDFEVMDLNDDDYVDLVTLQDGDGGGEGFRNRVLINNKNGGFTDESSTYWPPLENALSFDYMVAFLDANADRKPDMVTGAFADFKDRLVENVGGKFQSNTDPWGALKTDGTYALAVGDLNNDTKIDLVLAEGENTFRNRVFLGDEIDLDTAKPVIQNHVFEGIWTIGEVISINARAHDNKSPSKDHDWNEVVFEYATDGADIETDAMETPLEWYGEYLWRGIFDVPDAKTIQYRICAEDAAGNRECTPIQETEIEDPNDTDTDTDTDSMTDSNTDSMTDSNTDSMTDSNTDSNTDSMSDSNSATESESNSASASDSVTASDSASASASATDSVTASDSASVTDSVTASDSNTDSDSATTGGFELDDDGCGCNAADPRNGAMTGLALLALLGLRRRRR